MVQAYTAAGPRRGGPLWRLAGPVALAYLAAGLSPALLPAQAPGAGPRVTPPDPVDTTAIHRLKDEGFRRSQVMELAGWLTDVYGPRLTGSPITQRAGDWALEQFRRWGLANPHYEWWGPFGRGWVNERMLAQVTAPVAFPVIAYPSAWTEGTRGVVRTDVVLVPATVRTAADFAPYRGRLRGKIVMYRHPLELAPLFTAPAQRYTRAQLDSLANPYPLPPRRQDESLPSPRAWSSPAPGPASRPVDLWQCLLQEGVVATLHPGEGSGGSVAVSMGARSSFAADAPRSLPVVRVAAEHYGRLYRLLAKGLPVRMELEVKNTFSPKELHAFNLIAELPGTEKADEVVMLGAHFDSWHAGTGATDNAAGVAVMMEAMRILKATGVPLRRTVRLGLWTGEEQGLLGSRAYVAAHFGDPASSALTSAHAKLSAYYNVDNGTGAIRGIYLQGNAAVGPIFASWMRPLHSDSISVGHLAPGNTGGTDHEAFDAVGLPGFQFIQDPMEYDSRTHHTSQDLYERLQPADLRHNAVVVATFAYLTANRAELLPRKPRPAPPAAHASAGGGGPGAGGAAPATVNQVPLGCPAQ